MSEIIPINNSTSSFSIEKNEIDKNECQKTKEKSKQINPISLLSKDLLEKINTFDEKNFESKKDNNINDYMQLDETHKDSEENEEEDDEDDYILEIEKENEKNMFSFEIYKNEKNDNSNEDKIKQKANEKDIRFSQPIPSSNNNNNSNNGCFENTNRYYSFGRFSYDCPQFQNKNEIFDTRFNNQMNNQINFFNNCFTMNGKSGWVCSNCKNFNYESKSILLNQYLIYKYR